MSKIRKLKLKLTSITLFLSLFFVVYFKVLTLLVSNAKKINKVNSKSKQLVYFSKCALKLLILISY